MPRWRNCWAIIERCWRSRPGTQPVIHERMILLDINTFFAEKAGGIRTFYRAKISFFERQLAHRYYLVYPGARRAIVNRSPNVTLAEFYGPQVSKEPGGYRWMLDYAGVLALIRKAKPDVIVCVCACSVCVCVCVCVCVSLSLSLSLSLCGSAIPG